MHKRVLMVAALVGLVTGSMAAAAMTFLDWRANPAGIFHGVQGTAWDVVYETALSWLWPVGLAGFVVAAIALYLYAFLTRNR